MATLVMDTEVYKNYFLLMLRNVDASNPAVYFYEMYDGKPFNVE